MSELRGLKKVLHQWGGGTAAFFAYTHFSHDLLTGLMVAMLPLVRKDLGLNYLESSLLVMAYTLISGISQLPMGWLGDRAKRNVVAAIGVGGVSLAAIGAGLSSSYYFALVFMVIMGIFGGAYHPSATSLLTGYFESGRRGSVIGIHLLGGSIGFTVGPILGGLIGDALGWRLAFIILSIPALVAVPLVIKRFTPREVNAGEISSRKPASDRTSARSKDKPSLGQVLRPVASITILAIVVHLIAGSSITFIPLYLVDKHGVAPAHAAMLLAVVRGGGMVGSLLGGWLSDKWGRKNAVVLALALTGPLLYLITKSPFNAVLMITFAVFGIVMYTRQSAIQAFLMDSTPAQLRATVFGIYFGLSQEGMSLAQPVAGHFMDIFGIILVFEGIAWASIALSIVVLFWAKGPKLHR